MVQDIPSPAVDYSKELHNMNLKGKWDVDWGKKHKEHISYWDSRLDHVFVVDNVGFGVTDCYDLWYGDITRPYHTRMAAVGSYMIRILDRVSSIARGEVSGGGYSLIDSLATRERGVLEYQYSRGLFQDFPVDDRHVREETLRGKPKKVGHKGGRGGINAPKRRKMDIGNEGGDHVDVGEDVHLGDEAGHHNDTEIPNVDLSASSSHPSFDLVPPTDFQLPPSSQLPSTSTVQPSPSDWVPSFRLLPSNYFLTPPLEEPGQQQQPPMELDTSTIQTSASNWAPSFRLLSSNDFLTPPAQPEDEHVQQQQPLEEPVQDQQPPLQEPGRQPPVEEFVVEHPELEQLHEQQPVVEEQQEAPDLQERMRLRPRNRHPPGCGTKGQKIVPPITYRYRRLRKQYP